MQDRPGGVLGSWASWEVSRLWGSGLVKTFGFLTDGLGTGGWVIVNQSGACKCRSLC